MTGIAASVDFVAIAEDEPGPKWQTRFAWRATPYLAWLAREADDHRPSHAECRAAVASHLPELAPVYDRLCDLVGPDATARRLLSQWMPPPLFGGCSVVVAPGGEPAMVRNYDFTPAFFEGTLAKTRWTGGQGAVIAMTEGFSGVLDGMNESGLAVVLTFGGRPGTGPGFSIPIILRHVLETCADVPAAVEVLRRVPCAMAQNVLLLDRAGRHCVAWLGPDRAPEFTPLAFTTNHQRTVDWLESARFSQTVERAAVLADLRTKGARVDDLVAAAHRPPLYRTAYAEGLGTLYTAVYRPGAGTLDLHWPGVPPMRQSFAAFEETTRTVDLGRPAA